MRNLNFTIISLFLLINTIYSQTQNFYNYLNQAHQLRIAGEYSKAIEIYNKLLKQQHLPIDQLINIYFELAEVYKLTGEFKKRDEIYNLAISKIKEELIKTENIFLKTRLGEIYEKLNRLDEAEKVYNEILEKNPSYLHIFHKLCNIWQQENIIEEKIIEYKDRLKNNPTINNFQLLSEIYKFTNKVNEAILVYKEAIVKYPDYLQFYQELANLLKNQRQYEEAIRIYNKIIEINPSSNFVYYPLAEIYSELGKRETAIHYYRKAYNFNSNNLDSCRNLGSILFNKTWYEDALKVYNECRREKNILCREIADLQLLLRNYIGAIDEYINYIKYEQGDIYYVKDKLLNELKENNLLEVFINKLIKYRNNKNLILLAAYTYIENKNYQEAINTILNSNIEDRYNLLLQLAQYLTSKDKDVTLLVYDEIEKNFIPLKKHAQLEKVKILIELDKPSEALSILNTMEDNLQIIHLKAIAYKINKNYDEAIKLFQLLIKNNYLVNEMQLQLADSFYANLEFDKAKEEYKKVSSRDYSLFMQANCFYYLFEFEKASELYKELVSNYYESQYVNDSLYKINFIRNTNLNLLKMYVEAELLINKKNYIKAQEILNNINTDYALYLLWQIYFIELNDKLKAKIYYNELLKNYPDSIYISFINEKVESL